MGLYAIYPRLNTSKNRCGSHYILVFIKWFINNKNTTHQVWQIDITYS